MCVLADVRNAPSSFPPASLGFSAGEVVRETESSVWWNGTENMIYSLHACIPPPVEKEIRDGSWKVGTGSRREKGLGDRRNIYSPHCELILHFIGALFNQWQIFVVAMASCPPVRVHRSWWPFLDHNYLPISSKEEIDYNYLFFFMTMYIITKLGVLNLLTSLLSTLNHIVEFTLVHINFS